MTPLATTMLESSWTLLETSLVLFTVLSWAGHFKLEGLTEENLIEVEPRRGGVETNLLACRLFKVSCTHLFRTPSVLGGTRFGATHACNLVLNADRPLVFHDHLFVSRLRYNLLAGVTVTS